VKKNVVKWRGGRLDFSAGCLVMGVLNVTPDSFSNGGEFLDADRAVERGVQMAAEGAAIIDVGGESTRPASQGVAPDEQIRRVVPVIERLSKEVDVPLSIDTRNAEVAEAALDAGAGMINDITALRSDRMGALAGQREAAVVLMHMQGEPATMQVAPHYADVVEEVRRFLLKRAAQACSAGVAAERIFIDPGIGFGKTLEHNLLLLRQIGKFAACDYRVLVGTSRKGFIGSLTGRDTPAERVFGTAATVAFCAAAGVSIVRVHDVAAMVDVLKVTRAICAR